MNIYTVKFEYYGIHAQDTITALSVLGALYKALQKRGLQQTEVINVSVFEEGRA